MFGRRSKTTMRTIRTCGEDLSLAFSQGLKSEKDRTRISLWCSPKQKTPIKMNTGGKRVNRCNCQRLLLMTIPIAVLFNILFPYWVVIKLWQEEFPLSSPNDVPMTVPVDFVSVAPMGGVVHTDSQTSEFHSPQYNHVCVWNVPPNISSFQNNLYHQWWRWRNDRESTPDALVMDLQEITSLSSSNEHGTSSSHSLIQVNLQCGNILRESIMGTGNYVQLIYLLRISAAGTVSPDAPNKGAIDIQLACIDSNFTEAATKLVLPWLTGRFSSQITRKFLNNYWRGSTFQDVEYDYNFEEGGWENSTVGWMLPFIRDDMRWMAIHLVGLPPGDDSHPAHEWFQQQDAYKGHPDRERLCASHARITHAMDSDVPIHPQELTPTPLIPGVELDDVAIHFRCGDVMASKDKPFRARRFLKYKEYARRINNSSKSIGIIAQPVGNIGNKTILNGTIQARPKDQDDEFRVSLCEALTVGLADYLQEQFPHARVSLRNGPRETVALAFARLVMARQAFSSADSSFPLFPVLATFGDGYQLYPLPRRNVNVVKNQFLIGLSDALEQVDAQSNDSIGKLKFMKVPPKKALFADKTMELRLADEAKAFRDIVRWFRDDDFFLRR